MAIQIPVQVRNLYLKAPSPHRETMLQMRRTILKMFPTVQETVSYGMPAFKINNVVVAGFLAHKKHVGYYPFSGSVLCHFQEKLKGFSYTKSALHVPPNRPLPKSLLKALIKARISNCEVTQGKTSAKPAGTEIWSAVGLSAPAQRALVNAKIFSIRDLRKWSETDLLALHGFGPSSLPKVKKALRK